MQSLKNSLILSSPPLGLRGERFIMKTLFLVEDCIATYQRCKSEKTGNDYLLCTIPPNRLRSFPTTLIASPKRLDFFNGLESEDFCQIRIYLDTSKHTFYNVAYPIEAETGLPCYIKLKKGDNPNE